MTEQQDNPTDDQLNAYMATEVMGWKLVKTDDFGPAYQDANGVYRLTYKWHPFTNIEQAFMALLQWHQEDVGNRYWQLNTNGTSKVWATLTDCADKRMGDRATSSADTPARALCLAIYQMRRMRHELSPD